MHISLNFRGLKIISINSSHNGSHKKTLETNSKIAEIKRQMAVKGREISAFRKHFDKSKHYLEICYFWFVPEKRFYTAKGDIAERIGDWSNFPKIYDDVILNDVIGIDDGRVKKGEVSIFPHPGEIDYISVRIAIRDACGLGRFWELTLCDEIKKEIRQQAGC